MKTTLDYYATHWAGHIVNLQILVRMRRFTAGGCEDRKKGSNEPGPSLIFS